MLLSSVSRPKLLVMLAIEPRFLAFVFLSQFVPCMICSSAFAQSEMRLSVVQYKIEGDRTLSQFLEKVERHIQRAVEQKVDIVLLPELITFDTWQVSQVETHSQPAGGNRGNTPNCF